MKKLAKSLYLSLILLVAFSAPASAQIEMKVIENTSAQKLLVTGFYDYYPFGYFDDSVSQYHGVFDQFIDEFANLGKYRPEYLAGGDYEEMIRQFSRGFGDVVLGMYNETSLYYDLKFIYPAAIDNPLHLVMLPNRIAEVKNTEDLKKMKGAVHSKEKWGDYMDNRLKDFDVEYIDNSQDLYAKLMKGEIDFVLTSFYFGVIEVSKLGLKSMVSFSKQSLWSIPVFIGISKASHQRDYLVHHLSRMLEKPETQQKIKNRMLELVRQAEIENAGVVPFAYEVETPQEDKPFGNIDENNPLLSNI